MTFSLREMTAEDGPALNRLFGESPDSGAVQVAQKILIDPVQFLTLEPETVGVVATHPDHNGIAGCGLVTMLDVRLQGQVYRAAYLSTLSVHPAARRRGLATRITQWRIDHAESAAGEDVVVFANIQRGNEGSTANARKWATHILGATDVYPTSTLKRAPKPKTPALFRPASPQDYAAFANGANAYYANTNLYPPLSVDAMTGWANNTPLGSQVNRWWLAEYQGQVVAGIGVHDKSALAELHFGFVPLPIRIANLFLRVIPADNIARETVAVHMWHAPGREDFARDLFTHLRYQYGKTATLLRVHVDPRTSLDNLPGVSRWSPKSTMATAVRAPVELDESRPTYAYLRL